MIIKQSSSTKNIMFFMADSSDHISGKTGITPTVTISKNGGSFASASGAVTEVGNGWYKLAGNATDSNTLGDLILHATGTGADSTDTYIGEVVLHDITTDGVTSSSIQDGAITPAKGYVIAGTVNATSTTLRVYTALGVTGARTYNNMCLYSASNGERSRIMSTGNGYFNVRGFSTAPADTTVLRIYSDGCL